MTNRCPLALMAGRSFTAWIKCLRPSKIAPTVLAHVDDEPGRQVGVDDEAFAFAPSDSCAGSWHKPSWSQVCEPQLFAGLLAPQQLLLRDRVSASWARRSQGYLHRSHLQRELAPALVLEGEERRPEFGTPRAWRTSDVAKNEGWWPARTGVLVRSTRKAATDAGLDFLDAGEPILTTRALNFLVARRRGDGGRSFPNQNRAADSA
jgi:hypothetical protein